MPNRPPPKTRRRWPQRRRGPCSACPVGPDVQIPAGMVASDAPVSSHRREPHRPMLVELLENNLKSLLRQHLWPLHSGVNLIIFILCSHYNIIFNQNQSFQSFSITKNHLLFLCTFYSSFSLFKRLSVSGKMVKRLSHPGRGTIIFNQSVFVGEHRSMAAARGADGHSLENHIARTATTVLNTPSRRTACF